MKLTQEQLAALLALVDESANDETPVSERETAPIPKGTQFSSLGFVAIGKGDLPDPGEGAYIQVPTKAGKLADVVTVQKIDTSPFAGEFGNWAYTYRRLKRGETPPSAS